MYKQIWHDRLVRDIASLSSVLEKSPFNDWEKHKITSSSVELPLGFGIGIRFGDGSPELARCFFERSRSVHARAMADNKYEAAMTTRFLQNRADANFADELAGALIEDRPLNTEALRRSLVDLQAFHGGAEKPLMDNSHWSDRLTLAEAFLVAGDAEGCAAVLKIVGSKPKLADRIKIVRALAKGTNLDDLNFRTEFARYFDGMRKPGKVSEFYTISVSAKLLWGALYQFRVLGNEPFSWDRAIAAASG
jgi:hypothetical protein